MAIDNQNQIADIQTRIAKKKELLSQAQGLGYTPTQPILGDIETGKIAPPPVVSPTTPSAIPEASTGNAVLDSLMAKMKDWESPTDVYKRLRTDLGLEAKEAGVAGIRTQVQKTEDLINNLEKDINARISGQDIIEPMRRRMLAVEGAPLREQYAQLVKGQGRAEQGLTSTRQQLQDLYGAETKTTPYQDLVKFIAEQQAKEAISPTAPKTIGSAETGIKSWNPKTQKYDIQETQPIVKTPSISEKYGAGIVGEYNFYVEQEKNAGRTPMSFNEYQTIDANRKKIEDKKTSTEINQQLFNVGIPYTVVSETGKITDSKLNELTKSNIPPNTAQGIMDEILKGTSLEELRQWFRSKGAEMIKGKPIMDIFMETIQEVKANKKSKSKIDILLERI